MCIGRHLKETVLWGTITWSEVGKQNIQAEKVYCPISGPHSWWSYHTPGLTFFEGPFWRGLSTEGNLPFKIDCASLMVRRRFTIFALFYFVFGGNFQVQAPRGGLYLEGQFNGGGGFSVTSLGGLCMEGLIFGILWSSTHLWSFILYFLIFLLCLNTSISLLKFKVWYK